MSRLNVSCGRPRVWAAVAYAVALAGCATGRGAFPPESAVRPAQQLPDRFVVEGAAGEPTTSSTPGSRACRSPLVDARDGTRLRLVRSQEGRGDYEVSGERYGLGTGDLLRIDCTTNSAVGIVPRGR